MSEEHFVVAYDGPALAAHVMDVKDLAPALLSLSEAFHQAQHLLDPGAQRVNLQIRAFDAGSFEISMLLTETLGLLDQAIDMFNGRAIGALGGLGALTSAVWGSFKAVKWLAGRSVKRVRDVDAGTVELIASDDTSLRVDRSVVPLIRDLEYRRTVSEVVRPLGTEGVTEFKVTNTSVHLSITSDDLPAFAVPQVPDEDIDVSRRDVTLQPLGIEFDGRKWRFTEGGTQISAAIEDTDFHGRVERQEVTFGKNDLLRVRLRTRQYRDAQGRLKAEHAVEQVIRHIDGGRQLPFEFDA